MSFYVSIVIDRFRMVKKPHLLDGMTDAAM